MSNCGPSPCIDPTRSVMAFFPGTKGDTGATGPAGPASTIPGPPGRAGAVGVYTGTFDPDGTYYDNPYRKDIVAYNGGFWVTDNTAKNGEANWSAPTTADWAFFGTSLVNVATAIELLVPANILVGLNIAPPGFLKSDNFVALTDGWLLSGAGQFEAYDGIFSGFVSTNTPKFNLESPDRTMPGVAQVSFDIPALADGDIPSNPTVNNVTDDSLIFFGWKQGANTHLENRFGNTTQKFDVSLSGIGQNDSVGTDLFYLQIYYRTRDDGGAWGAWTVIGQDAYMNKLASQDQSFSFNRPLSIALTGDNDIQFSAGFSKGAAGPAIVSLSGAQITVTAYN